MCRPLNSHGATVRLTVSAVISRSHGGGLISHGLLSMSMTDLPINSDVARIYKVYLNNLYWAQSYSPGKEDSNDTQFVKIGPSVLELHIKT